MFLSFPADRSFRRGKSREFESARWNRTNRHIHTRARADSKNADRTVPARDTAASWDVYRLARSRHRIIDYTRMRCGGAPRTNHVVPGPIAIMKIASV